LYLADYKKYNFAQICDFCVICVQKQQNVENNKNISQPLPLWDFPHKGKKNENSFWDFLGNTKMYEGTSKKTKNE